MSVSRAPSGEAATSAPEAPPWSAIDACRAVTERSARTFSLAAHVLPREIRAACYAVYAFCRRADDAVDEASSPEAAARALQLARARLESAYAAGGSRDPELLALSWAVRRFGIPQAPLRELLDGMALDLGPVRVRDRAELLSYCRLAAGTVGRALAPALGAPPAVADAAEALGIAMQLTNILRDVDEDFARGRVYLAADELLAAGAVVERRRADGPFRAFFAGQIAEARAWYARAEIGIRAIPSFRARVCVRAMGVLYGEILAELERRGLDPFSGRARVSLPRKLWLLCKSVFGRPLPGVLPAGPHKASGATVRVG